MKEQEAVILSNSVGTITSKVVKIKPAKGGFATLRLTDILAVQYKWKRKYLFAALCLVFGLGALLVALFPTEGSRFSIGSFLVPIVLLIAGMVNLLGYYSIEIRTKTASILLDDVAFIKWKDGRAFFETLQKMIPVQQQIATPIHQNQ